MVGLYNEVIAKVTPYLGSHSERFVGRQCKAHLKIEPELLTKEHLPELAVWMKISAQLVLDKEKAENLKNSILSL